MLNKHSIYNLLNVSNLCATIQQVIFYRNQNTKVYCFPAGTSTPKWLSFGASNAIGSSHMI